MSESVKTSQAYGGYGGWTSPISAAMVAAGAVRLNQPLYGDDGHTLYFLEGRPSEAGRQALVRRVGAGAGRLEDVTEGSVNIRSLVHEYGGGAVGFGDGLIFYSNYSDQRLYVIAQNGAKGKQAEALAISPEGPYRFSDYCVDARNKRVICVMEDHAPVKSGQAAEPVNIIVAFSYAGAAAKLQGDDDGAEVVAPPQILVQGSDFYAFPRLSADRSQLAFMRWEHPNLPWDDSQLIVLDLTTGKETVVAGQADASVFQPQWAPDGTLFFVSDCSGFWNLYAYRPAMAGGRAEVTSVTPAAYSECEFGQPLWVFGQSTYVVVDERTLICAVNKKGLWSLIRLDLDWTGAGRHKSSDIESPYTDVSCLSLGRSGASNNQDFRVAMLAGAASIAEAVVEYNAATNSFISVRSSAPTVPDSGYVSKPDVIEFPTEGGLSAFAFFYAPTSKDFAPVQNPNGKADLPPLLVKCHGGPTGAAGSDLSLGIQFWTSRGFAVVDVNYGGSTGYGRAYRKRLNDNWGIVDVDDCVNVVKYLTASGRVDGARVAITGGSAGGYTVLCALTFKDIFKAGASHYGIGDLEALVRDTHKFEARYLDNLVGPYPAGVDIYKARSPIHHVEKLQCPVIFFQGLEDKVVPPNQAEAMVAALDAKKIPVAYLAYEGEQHGFRQAANIVRTLEAELYFYRRIFNIVSDEKLPAVEIKNAR
ncbi:MAG: prolyl oligopeptidase family serine peptidase [Cyanobacteria bacterium REEB67]|nr:prolyl oligopeptidase family serine peptidase [Cyanobacteria bacterium REEB67]